MDPEERTAYGVEGEWPLVRRHRIRWSECDMYAHVNHAAYFTLFEDLRVAYWLELGGGFAPDGAGPVVAQIEARYLKPGGFGDDVRLTCRTAAVRRSSFTHEYAMWRRGDGLICSGRAVCVVIRNDTGEKLPIPPEIRRVMLERDGAKDESGG